MEIFSPLQHLPSGSPSMFSRAPFSTVPAYPSSVSFQTPGQHQQCPYARAFRKRGTSPYPDWASTSSLNKTCVVSRASWHSPDHLHPQSWRSHKLAIICPWGDPSRLLPVPIPWPTNLTKTHKIGQMMITYKLGGKPWICCHHAGQTMVSIKGERPSNPQSWRIWL